MSFTLDRGKTLGIVGESGSGKSVLSRSIMGLLPKRNAIREGTVASRAATSRRRTDELRDVWGTEMAMVFQDPMTSLNPVMKIGNQITESPLPPRPDQGRRQETAVALLRSVGIPEPERRLEEYPHQLSGGMRQRVMIAIALACGPELLFADEPTTALDVTVQAQILDLLQRQQRERYMAMILVTHDLGVVAGRTDEIAVMYAGQIVEKAPTRAVRQMRMPYTEALLKSIPKLEQPEPHPAARSSPAGRRTWSTRRRAASSPRAARTRRTVPHRGAAAAHRGETAGHLYRCWFPVGTGAEPRSAQPRRRRRAGHGAGGRPARRWRRRRPVETGAVSPDGRHRHRPPPPADEALLRVEDLVVEFPAGAGLKVHAVSGHQPRRARGRDARPRRRVGLRQVDDRQGDHAAAAPDVGQVRFEGRRPDPAEGRGAAQAAPRAADDLPGPDLVAEPAAQGRGHRRRAAAIWKRRQGRARGQSPRCSTRSASTPTWPSTAGRTSSPAASASASRSPGRSCSTRS